MEKAKKKKEEALRKLEEARALAKLKLHEVLTVE